MPIRRVTLVRCDPQSSNVYAAFSHPGLALPILGTVLTQAGYGVRIYVDAIQPAPWAELAGSDLVGFTVNSACFEESYRLGDRVRYEARKPVVFGGPHVSYNPDEGLCHADFVVRGEGEGTLLELVRALDQGRRDFGDIAGLSWRAADGSTHHNPDRALQADIDLIPDQSLIVGYERFNRRWWQRFFPTGVLVSTSRGCPFRCTFCTIPQTFGQSMRFRSPGAVIEDIRRQIAFSGHRYVYFADDNFTGQRARAKELLARIIEARLDIRFSAQLRADITRDAELMDLLAAAGCYLVFVGFESINETTLRAYKKGIRARSVLEDAVSEFRRRGIMIHGMFVIGADEDPPGTALSTAEWAIRQRLDSLQMLPLCPLPGTEILAALDAAGRVYKRWDSVRRRLYIPYAAGSFVLHRPKQTSAVQLQRELTDAYRRFYSLRRILAALLASWRRGLDPLIFRAMGWWILSRARADIGAHTRWLAAQPEAAPGIAEAS